jgi:thioredoxin reductase (NADPH)
MDRHKIVIVGSGPAAFTAAIYAARANLNPVVFSGAVTTDMVPGGQLMTTTDVENFPGFKDGILGPELMENCRLQAERFGTKIIGEDVLSIDMKAKPFVIESESGKCQANAIIIATGAVAKKLEIDGADTFWQKGVSACAVCDGALPLFRNKALFVIGGGDSAIEEAVFLTKFGSKVYIVHRRNEFRASKIMGQRALEHPKIEVLWDSVVDKIEGDQIVRKVTIKNVKNGAAKQMDAAGVFFAIGHQPNTGFLNGQLTLNETGYILVKPGTSYTNIPGIFAAGDVQDPVYRQAVTAAGSGCMAALDAERWLSHNGVE